MQVDTNAIHQVDTKNPDNLFSMWTVFAKCADSVAQGRRLENLSWRLWTRETVYYEGRESRTAYLSSSTLPREIPQSSRYSPDDVPQLSGSVDSIVDEEAVEFTSETPAIDIVRPRIRRQDSHSGPRGRGRDKHITSDNLEKMVITIIEAKEPLDAPLPDITASFPTPTENPLEKPREQPTSESSREQPPTNPPKLPELPELRNESPGRSGSTTSESSSDSDSMASLQRPSPPEIPASNSRTTVIRGFSPCQIPVTRITLQSPRGPSPNAIPEPSDAPAPKIVQPKKQQAKFALGGSSGSGDDSYSDRGHSLETRKQPVLRPALPPPAPQRKKMFLVGGSSEEESSLKSALHSSKESSLLTAQKKTASFSHQLVTRTISTPAVVDDQSETDYVDESAIDDDDDSSDWEDSIEDSGKSSVDEKFNFQRVDSKANLTSRRSLITLMLAQNDRAHKLGNVASQSTSALPRPRTSRHGPSLVASPNDSDDAPLMMKRPARGPPPMRPINEIPRSAAQPIMTTTNGVSHQAALSPRTTRRNMLATELTESLRRHLLWERSQKTSTANAVLKRRHTSHDVANLKQYPEKPFMKKDNDVNASNSNPGNGNNINTDNDSDANTGQGSWHQYFKKEVFNNYHLQGW